MSIEIQPVRTRRDIKECVRLPFKLYRNDPCWAPPLLSERRKSLDPRHNPFYEHADVALWLARRGGEVVGAISSHIDHLHNRIHGESIGMFGFFETVDDYAVAEALLATARDWVRRRGMTALRGPLSFSQNQECGAFVGGDPGPPTLMMPYNPPYYIEFYERFGLTKAMDLYAYLFDLTQFDGDPGRLPPRLVRLAERVRKRTRATLRSTDKSFLTEDIQKIRTIYNQAWEKNWGFVPLTDAEIERIAADLQRICDPALIVGAEIDGEPAGMSLAIPDYNQVLKDLNGRLFPVGWIKALRAARSITRTRTLVFGVIEKYRGQGLEALLTFETLKAAILRGYEEFEFSWILETNEMMNRFITVLGRGYGVRVYRTYRIYQMLTEDGSHALRGNDSAE